MILAEILAHKRAEVAAQKARWPLDQVQTQARRQPPPRDFAAALRSAPDLAIIAEVKRASPSAGAIRPDADPVELARCYARAGAAAISVLTDHRFFRGSLDDLVRVRQAVDRPVLRKDFLIDPYQVWEARAAGADAVLLIVAALADVDLIALQALANDLGMAALVEVHTAEEVERALRAEARLIGINNRDLRTFTVDLTTTERLRPLIPPDRLVVSESGIQTAADVARLRRAGVRAVLVGEALMRAPDPAVRLREFQEAGR